MADLQTLQALTAVHPPTWQHLSPASTMWNLEESIMKGTRLASGSDTSRLTKRVMAGTPSIRPSSMLMSSTSAPALTCGNRVQRAHKYQDILYRFKLDRLTSIHQLAESAEI